MEKDGRPRGRPASNSMLLPSGEDANPLNRRLPAEIVSRRRPNARGQKTEERLQEEVEMDMKAVLALKAEARPKWLAKACKMAEDGRTSVGELYNIVSSRKFAAGLPTRIGRKLASLLRDNLELFSDKQQRYLKSKECLLIAGYSADGEGRNGLPNGSNIDKAGQDAVVEEQDSVDAAARMEEMMARCRAFVREKATTFEDRAAECAETERRAREQAILEFEHARLLAEDFRLHQRAREEQERARREAQEREEREARLAYEAEMASRRAQEEALARKRQLEYEVDNSVHLALERGSTAADASAAASATIARAAVLLAGESRAQAGAKKGRQRGLSRSRSVSSAGARSSSTGSRKRRSRKGAERRGRRRSGGSSSSRRRRGRKRDGRDDGKKRARQRSSSSSSSSRKAS